jgi:hypothetical protein
LDLHYYIVSFVGFSNSGSDRLVFPDLDVLDFSDTGSCWFSGSLDVLGFSDEGFLAGFPDLDQFVFLLD